jgi:hypothetical protein
MILKNQCSTELLTVPTLPDQPSKQYRLIGLEKHYMMKNTLLAPCIGGMRIVTASLNAGFNAGHGRTNILTALKVSCDVFFMTCLCA